MLTSDKSHQAQPSPDPFSTVYIWSLIQSTYINAGVQSPRRKPQSAVWGNDTFTVAFCKNCIQLFIFLTSQDVIKQKTTFSPWKNICYYSVNDALPRTSYFSHAVHPSDCLLFLGTLLCNYKKYVRQGLSLVYLEIMKNETSKIPL